jgi:hypothetical protein
MSYRLRHRQDLLACQLHAVHVAGVLLYGAHELVVAVFADYLAAIADYLFLCHRPAPSCLPPGNWVDHEAAADAIHEAEAALKAGDPAGAYGPSAVAHHIARRPFMPGEEGEWFERRREKLASILVRALECRAEVYLWNDEPSLALEVARDAVALRPTAPLPHPS